MEPHIFKNPTKSSRWYDADGERWNFENLPSTSCLYYGWVVVDAETWFKDVDILVLVVVITTNINENPES